MVNGVDGKNLPRNSKEHGPPLMALISLAITVFRYFNMLCNICQNLFKGYRELATVNSSDQPSDDAGSPRSGFTEDDGDDSGEDAEQSRYDVDGQNLQGNLGVVEDQREFTYDSMDFEGGSQSTGDEGEDDLDIFLQDIATNTLDDIKNSASQGCHLCTILWEGFQAKERAGEMRSLSAGASTQVDYEFTRGSKVSDAHVEYLLHVQIRGFDIRPGQFQFNFGNPVIMELALVPSSGNSSPSYFAALPRSTLTRCGPRNESLW